MSSASRSDNATHLAAYAAVAVSVALLFVNFTAASQSAPSLSVSPSVVSDGSSVSVSWSYPGAELGAWAALVKQDASTFNDTTLAGGGYAWFYLNSCSKTLGSSGASSGTCSLTIPASLPTGSYALELFGDTTFNKPVAQSSAITLSAPPSPPTSLTAACTLNGSGIPVGNLSWSSVSNVDYYQPIIYVPITDACPASWTDGGTSAANNNRECYGGVGATSATATLIGGHSYVGYVYAHALAGGFSSYATGPVYFSCPARASSLTVSTQINAVKLSSTTIVPLARTASGGAIGFTTSGATVTAVDEAGKTLWQKDLVRGNLFGGFDFDGDGVPDFGIAAYEPGTAVCGASTLGTSYVNIYSGATGAELTGFTPRGDICWPQFGYATVEWESDSVLFGTVPETIAAAPEFATQGYYLYHHASGNSQDTYYYPSTSSYDAEYPAAELNASNGQTKYLANSHIQNGLLLSYGGVNRLVLFTSGRAMQYAIGPLAPSQLIADRPFLARPDLAGRNYGTVSDDPANPRKVALVSGSDTYFYFLDAQAGAAQTDPWGNIERHVAIYDLSANTIDNRFFSYAHDDNDGWKYRGRIVSPTHIWLPSAGQGSELIYNDFDNGAWTAHISEPDSTADSTTVGNLFVWDVRYLMGGSTAYVIASPTANGPSSPLGAYLPERKTNIYAWDPAEKKLSLVQQMPGIPYLASALKEPNVATSDGWIFPVLVGLEQGRTGLYTASQGGAIQFTPFAFTY